MSHRPLDVWNLAVELTNMGVVNTDAILELAPKTLKVTVVETEKTDDPKKLRMKALYKTSAGPLKILPDD